MKIPLCCLVGQLLLPLFVEGTEMLTLTLGFRKQDTTVYYLHSGMPIYLYEEHDLNKFRYIISNSNFLLQGLCTIYLMPFDPL